MREKMQEKERKIMEYIVMCIGEFASQTKITQKEAYLYLRDFGGIAFLKECYEAEHTLGLDNTIEVVKEVCKNNGGKIE